MPPINGWQVCDKYLTIYTFLLLYCCAADQQSGGQAQRKRSPWELPVPSGSNADLADISSHLSHHESRSVQVKAGSVDSSLAGILSFIGQKDQEQGHLPNPQVDPLQAARSAAAGHLFRFASVSALCFGVVVGVHHLEPLRGVTSQTQQVNTLSSSSSAVALSPHDGRASLSALLRHKGVRGGDHALQG